MAKPPSPRQPMSRRAAAAVDAASWYCAVAVVALILLALFHQDRPGGAVAAEAAVAVSGRPCDEIYVVEEGETLHTISDRCDDPFIVERNPHIHDPDDIFPGLVIRLSPSTSTRR
ncbi:uncharacterized protein LOC116261180 [Nymphaea colorata]|uniref:LysM domain-containing protein n=1 Tax=Nymphaea colorata TaxID=210225 RepID=A0A5K1GWY8_9MAGN|nr:uncharacterized protein LOC116261180 [Nymphaea colorata]